MDRSSNTDSNSGSNSDNDVNLGDTNSLWRAGCPYDSLKISPICLLEKA